jgi:hypothetical protein
VDVIGTLPTPEEVLAFVADTADDKRARLIDALLQRDEFADYWSLKWCDLLRVKAEFPVKLWPNAVQAYHRWIRDAIRDGMPYDQFVRQLLTSSGSDFRAPPANFYRAVQGRDAGAIAAAVGLTFMGVRVDRWPEAQRAGLAAFFKRVAYKKTDEWKEEIVYCDFSSTETLRAGFPDGREVAIPPDKDPRVVFADWLITPENPWFTRNIANRVWSWLFGRGIIHEPDDLRPDNPPANPELLACLQSELVSAHYDLRHLYRLILNSRTYQQSSIPRATGPAVVTQFACYPVRRLDAEVLIDALCWIGGTGESYQSIIPEPYTNIPPSNRTIALADGSITSPFLEMFGRPARDTGLESERSNDPTDAQRLHLLNSTDVQRKIENSPQLRKLFQDAHGNRAQLIRSIYLMLLSRYPSPQETAAVENYLKSGGVGPKQSADDLAWALINSKEFLYRH